MNTYRDGGQLPFRNPIHINEYDWHHFVDCSIAAIPLKVMRTVLGGLTIYFG